MKMNAKKVLGMVLAGVLAAGSLTACGGSAKTEPTQAPAGTEAPAAESKDEGKTESGESTEAAASQSGGYELALVTDLGTIDDKSFNQGAWEGLKKYAEENSIT